MVGATRKNKSVWPDGISGEILKLGGEAMIPYLARLLDITMNNGTLPADWNCNWVTTQLQLTHWHTQTSLRRPGSLGPLTLRLLMSYMEHLFLMFLDHIRRRSTVGRTPLDE